MLSWRDAHQLPPDKANEMKLIPVIVALKAAHANCDRRSCPWPSFTDEDISELACALADAGQTLRHQAGL